MPGFTRSSSNERATKYKNLIRIAKMDGTEAEEVQTLKEWVGIAKSRLKREQLAELLLFIYGNLTPDEEIYNWILDTYGKEIKD